MANYIIQGNQTNPITGELLNYYQQDELIGDIVINGEIVNWSASGINSATILTILPITTEDDIDYTVAASNFSCINLSDLSSRVANVTFTDSGTPGTTGNTVLVTVDLQPTFQLDGTSANDTITLRINGEAVEWVEPNITFDVPIISEQIQQGLEGNVFQNANSTPTITMNSGFYRDTIVSGNISENILTGVVIPNTPTEIGTLSVPGDSGYYFEKGTPYLSLANMKSDVLKLVPSNITRDSNNRITAYSFKIIYKNDVDLKRGSKSKAFLKWKTVKIPTRTTKEIKNITYGDSVIKKSGATRLIKVYGDPDSEFELTITNTNGYSIMDGKKANANIFNNTKGIVKGISKKLKSTGKRTGLAVYEFEQKFPANTGYRAIISGSVNDPTMTIDGNTSNIQVGDQLLYGDIPTGTIVTVASITNATVLELSQAVDQDDGDVVRFIRNEKYYINIYPKTGTTLNSSIPTVVPHFTLNQYKHPVLSFTATSSHDSATIPTVSYQGRAGADPSQIAHIPTIPRNFTVKYELNASSSTWANSPAGVFSSTDSTASSWTNSVAADNGGMEIAIFPLVNTGRGLTAGILQFGVSILKWGTQDVTMHLDLDALGWTLS